MNIHCVQHVPFEGPGNIENWVADRNHNLTLTKIYESAIFPGADSFDVLVIMGGPMGVYDENIYPWLVEEKNFIKKSIDANKTIIGICLGSQLIAEVLGAKVYKNTHKEIGWFPVKITQEAFSSLFNGFPQEPMIFHWHGDTFELPEGSVLIGSTPACVNQGFVYKENVIGMQFHLDSCKQGVNELITHCKKELTDGDYVQNENFLLSQTQYFSDLKQYLYLLLDNVVEIVISR